MKKRHEMNYERAHPLLLQWLLQFVNILILRECFSEHEHILSLAHTQRKLVKLSRFSLFPALDMKEKKIDDAKKFLSTIDTMCLCVPPFDRYLWLPPSVCCFLSRGFVSRSEDKTLQGPLGYTATGHIRTCTSYVNRSMAKVPMARSVPGMDRMKASCSGCTFTYRVWN